jgi:hypothetical protein
MNQKLLRLYSFTLTLAVMGAFVRGSNYSPSCQTISECFSLKTTAYYCNDLNKCEHVPMFDIQKVFGDSQETKNKPVSSDKDQTENTGSF